MSFRIRLIALCAAVFATSSLVSAAERDDACALATSAQVGAAVATPVGAGSYVTPTFKKTCTWTPAHASNGVKAVTLSLEGVQMYAAGKRAGANPGVSDTSVSGIGDEAYYMVVGSVTTLHIKKGTEALKVSVYATAPAEQVRAMERALAETAVAKL